MKIKSQVYCAIAAAVAISASALSASAGSDRVCAKHETVASRLNSAFGETRQLVGYTKYNHAVEIYASKESGTWTMTVTKTGGLTCLVSSGRNFDKMATQFARL